MSFTYIELSECKKTKGGIFKILENFR